MPYTTKQYQAILRCLERRREDALTAADLAEELRREACPVGLATIYRQLEKLEVSGLVHKITGHDGALYQYCPHPSTDHGCFLLRCASCGHIVHLDCTHLDTLCHHLESEHHFRIDVRQTVLTGMCQSCAEQEAVHGAT